MEGKNKNNTIILQQLQQKKLTDNTNSFENQKGGAQQEEDLDIEMQNQRKNRQNTNITINRNINNTNKKNTYQKQGSGFRTPSIISSSNDENNSKKLKQSKNNKNNNVKSQKSKYAQQQQIQNNINQEKDQGDTNYQNGNEKNNEFESQNDDESNDDYDDVDENENEDDLDEDRDQYEYNSNQIMSPRAIDIVFMQKREETLYIAKLAEQAENFEDMVEYMRKLVDNTYSSENLDESMQQQYQQQNTDIIMLNEDERESLWAAFWNLINSRRIAVRAILKLEFKEKQKEQHIIDTIKWYRIKIEEEIKLLCNEVIDIAENQLYRIQNPGEKNNNFSSNINNNKQNTKNDINYNTGVHNNNNNTNSNNNRNSINNKQNQNNNSNDYNNNNINNSININNNTNNNNKRRKESDLSDSSSYIDLEGILFYLKLKGDFNRYLSEVLEEQEQIKAVEESQQNYTEAWKILQDKDQDEETKQQLQNLKKTSLLRISIGLNYSVFQYEISNNVQEAYKIAKETFEQAINDKEIVDLEEEAYKECIAPIQTLRYNLRLWDEEIKQLEAKQQIDEDFPFNNNKNKAQ